jgi:tetratricopeptide (TPR) repeat protein
VKVPHFQKRSFGLSILLCILPLFYFPFGIIGERLTDCKGPSGLESVLTTNPSAEAYDALGSYFGSKGRFSCAIDAFQAAIRLKPNAWQGHYNLAIALISNRQAEPAYRELEIASRINPDAPKIHLGLGLALSQLQQPAAATREFEKVLTIYPTSVQALDGIAKDLIAEKRYSAAIHFLHNAPADPALQLDLAIAYSKNAEPDKASQILSAMVDETPTNAQAHTNLGIVDTQLTKYHQAADQFQEALRLDPNNDETRLSYVKALVILEEYSTALPVVEDYLHRKPHDFDALELAGEVDRGMGNYAEAETFLEQAVAVNPNQYEARYYLGFVLAKLNKLVEARVQLEKALDLNPGSSEARFQLARVLRSLGQQDEARTEFKIVQKKEEEVIKQNVAVTKANEANQYLQAGDTQKATELYQQSLAQDPNNSRTYYDLALALHRQGKYVQEQEVLMKSIHLDQKFAPAYNQLGVLNLQEGLTVEAEKQFKTAIFLNPQYAEAQSNLGVLYGRLGDTKQAEQMLRQATENNSQYEQAFVNLGLILASESHLSEAEKVLRHALQLDPNDQRAQTGLAMVLARLKHGGGTAH